jgi:hypothetical protein
MSRYEKVEIFIWQERFRLARKIVFVAICGVILFATFVLLDSMLPFANHYLIVRLDDGQMVRALISGDIPLEKIVAQL